MEEVLHGPSQYWHNRNRKIAPGSPIYKDKKFKDSSRCDSRWVGDQELRITGLQGLQYVEKEEQLYPVRNHGNLDIVRLLNACAKAKDLRKGSTLHEYILNHKSFEKNKYIGSTLISMYARCGALSKAQQVLNELPLSERDVVTWSALIAGYAQYGKGEEALKCFDSMQHEGHTPNAVTFTCALKACGRMGAIAKGENIHEKIACLGMLDADVVLGNTLVDMYARCGVLAKAQEVFDRLPVQNVVAWTALISGYAQQGHAEEALKCFDNMQRKGHSPNAFTFSCALKACGSKMKITKGEQIHVKIVSLGMLEKDNVLGSSLVDMYAKCGALLKAQQVLEDLPQQNVVTWTALIAGYVQQGQGEEALKCLDSMQHEGHCPNAVTLICALKACGIVGAVAKGEQIHYKIVSLGMFEKDAVLGGALVDMYASCGTLTKAHYVLEELPLRNVITWNALIAGYVEQGQCEEALKCFNCMQCEGHSPDVVTFSCALKACGSILAVTKGAQIHDKIVHLCMLENDAMLGNTLVGMYARCGALEKAHQVLSELPVRGVVTWNALIAGYVEQGQAEEALKCFDSMQHEGHCPNVVSFTCILKACGCIGSVIKGEEIHIKIVGMGMLEEDIVLGSTLIDMYVRCGALPKARQVLDQLPVRDVVAWTAVIAGYAQQGRGEEALNCFYSLQCEGNFPTVVTFICALKACGSMEDVAKGEEIHVKLVGLGLLEGNVVLGNAVVEMYGKCGVLNKAQEVFDELSLRDVVTWNTLIAGYFQQGHNEDVLKCFDGMQCEGHTPDLVTFTYALKACGSMEVITKGKQIHEKMGSLGMMEKDMMLGSSVVDMYARCGAFAKAQQVIDELRLRDVSVWNALIAGYAHQGQDEEALKCFESMQHEGCSPDSVTFIYALKACGSIGVVEKGEWIHDKMVSLLCLEETGMLGATVVDMYAKCAALAKAQEVFRKLPVHDVFAWTALMAGYAQQGHGEEVLNCFEKMHFKGVGPGSATLVCVLNACSHSGLLDHAEMYFSKMNFMYGIAPDVEHYCCMVDVFGRAGKLEKALVEIEKMPSADFLLIWLSLLGASFKWGDFETGRLAFEHALLVDKSAAAAYVCMANIYTAAAI